MSPMQMLCGAQCGSMCMELALRRPCKVRSTWPTHTRFGRGSVAGEQHAADGDAAGDRGSLHPDVLVEPQVDLWARVLRRQPMPLAMLATHPIDLSRN